ncbi:MAG: hypothetical protein ABI406_09805 [Ktedonobacteraceae bacterium]
MQKPTRVSTIAIPVVVIPRRAIIAVDGRDSPEIIKQLCESTRWSS